ncbi:ABC transporter ATP-binding protein [Psychrobacter sp. I-STPA10]|uniref:ABC transporter ATP-binding protein n=1 Tax=Psychrobacter sp. I-STPA10 TaxID=2585769 RepID=UPI001E57832A|nr:ABC transporter ATP-binding protein [Psychrobacter sp. I-STPA10]
MLTIDCANLTIDDKALLSNISLSFDKGKLYGLIGHNGSGKSTLIKMLAGEMQPTTGSVNYKDKPISKIPTKQLARQIAYLPQKLPDANAFTVEELVLLGRYPWQKWLQKPSSEDYEIAKQAMQQTRIIDKAKQNVSTLSGGERARVWLSMCLAQQTDYLLLDEPLASLDIVYQVEILQLIRKLAHEQNLGVIIIIHDINLAAQFCDDIIALKGGKICHEGSVEETLDPEVLMEIFGINLHVLNHPVDGHKIAVV